MYSFKTNDCGCVTRYLWDRFECMLRYCGYHNPKRGTHGRGK